MTSKEQKPFTGIDWQQDFSPVPPVKERYQIVRNIFRLFRRRVIGDPRQTARTPQNDLHWGHHCKVGQDKK